MRDFALVFAMLSKSSFTGLPAADVPLPSPDCLLMENEGQIQKLVLLGMRSRIDLDTIVMCAQAVHHAAHQRMEGIPVLV